MNDACPLPIPPNPDDDLAIDRMLRARRIAIVGLSADPLRASHGVAEYLQSRGVQIIPVNPNYQQVLGERCCASLTEVPGEIDLVNVFRRQEFCAQIAREAVARGVKGLWLQSGIVSEEAKRIAAQAEIDFVQDRCLMVEMMRRGQRTAVSQRD